MVVLVSSTASSSIQHLGCNSSKTGPGMAAWTSSMRTMRCWFLVSADVVTLSLPQNEFEGYRRPQHVRPSDMKWRIIERNSVHEVGDIPGVRFKVVKAEFHYFQELMCVMVCFSMFLPQISLGPLGHGKSWSRMKYMKWTHSAQLEVAGCGLGALYRNKKDRLQQ